MTDRGSPRTTFTFLQAGRFDVRLQRAHRNVHRSCVASHRRRRDGPAAGNAGTGTPGRFRREVALNFRRFPDELEVLG